MRYAAFDGFPWNYYLGKHLLGNKEVKCVGVSFCYSIAFVATFCAARFVNSAWTLTEP